MKPLDQTVFRKNYGDCGRACVASIFEFPIKEMPNFWEETQDASTFWRKSNDWLSQNKGYHLVPMSVSEGHEYLLDGVLCIAVGKTGRGDEDHAVVWRDGLVHDPNPARTGLKENPSVFVLIVPLDPLQGKSFI